MKKDRKVTRAKATTTPPGTPTMSVSEFLRGGVYQLDAPTVVMSHSTELGTWYPRGLGNTTNFYGSTSTTLTPDFSNTNTLMAASAAPPPNEPLDVVGINETIRQMREYLDRMPKTQEEEEKDA